jgi:hypothetical protein
MPLGLCGELIRRARVLGVMAAAILYLLKIEIQIWFEPKKKIKDSRNKIINCVSIVFFIIISSHYSSKLVKVNFHIDGLPLVGFLKSNSEFSNPTNVGD